MILNRLTLAPFCNGFRVDPALFAQRRERRVRLLYCCLHGMRGRGAAMMPLSHIRFLALS